MPGALILQFGDRKRLLSKRDSYAGLLDSTRKSFKELETLNDADITFLFVPEWCKQGPDGNDEVELDESAFEHIHDRALLRVITRSAPASSTDRRMKRSESDMDQKPHKRVKIEPDIRQGKEVVDLTESDAEEPPAPEASLSSIEAVLSFVKSEVGADQAASAQNEPTSRRSVHVEPSEEVTTQEVPAQEVPAQELPAQELPAQELSAQEVSAVDARPEPVELVENPMRLPLVPRVAGNVQLVELSNKAFSAHPNSPERMSAPLREEVPGSEWVGAGVTPGGYLTLTGPIPDMFYWVRVITERHVMKYAMKSDKVHLARVTDRLGQRGYTLAEHCEMITGGAFARGHTFRYIKNGADLYIHNRFKPGIYLICSTPKAQIEVEVQLPPDWRFCSRYPWTEIKASGPEEPAAERIKWTATINENGLVYCKVGSERHWGQLSWNAESRGPFSEGARPRMPKALIPANSLPTPDNSVVVPSAFLECWRGPYSSYLFGVLKEQSQVPNRICEDFAVYFHEIYLPQLNHGRPCDVAITFLTQKVINRSTTITIKPQPASILRIFMLFAVVRTQSSEEQWGAWRGVQLPRSPRDAVSRKDWSQIFLSSPRPRKDRLLRVVEWGMAMVPEEDLVTPDVEDEDWGMATARDEGLLMLSRQRLKMMPSESD